MGTRWSMSIRSKKPLVPRSGPGRELFTTCWLSSCASPDLCRTCSKHRALQSCPSLSEPSWSGGHVAQVTHLGCEHWVDAVLQALCCDRRGGLSATRSYQEMQQPMFVSSALLL